MNTPDDSGIGSTPASRPSVFPAGVPAAVPATDPTVATATPSRPDTFDSPVPSPDIPDPERTDDRAQDEPPYESRTEHEHY